MLYVQHIYENIGGEYHMIHAYIHMIQRARSFLTKEQRLSLLKEYQEELEKEKQGISERIKELEA